MKISRDGFEAENEEEQRKIEALQAQARTIAPRIKELWKEIDEVKVVSGSELGDLLHDTDAIICGLKRLLAGQQGKLMAIRGNTHSGRPMEDRTVLVSLKLLLCAPMEMVLAQEITANIPTHKIGITTEMVTSVHMKREKTAISATARTGS